MHLRTMQTVLALTAIALLAGCRAAAPTAEPVLGMPAEMPRYDFKLSLGYDKNDDVVLNWISERPARPECGEPLSMQCDFTIVIEENGPLPTSVSISQSHGIDGHKEGDGVRITSEAIVDGEVHRDEHRLDGPLPHRNGRARLRPGQQHGKRVSKAVTCARSTRLARQAYLVDSAHLRRRRSAGGPVRLGPLPNACTEPLKATVRGTCVFETHLAKWR
jgi:hypothetical protein